MRIFPGVRKDPDPQGRNHWMYVPSFSADEVDLDVDVRWAFYDEDPVRKDWSPGVPFADLGPGQVAVDNVNTRGTMTSVNCGPYLSPSPYFALVSLSLAETEGRRSRIRVVAS
jgi:hypothetical protein